MDRTSNLNRLIQLSSISDTRKDLRGLRESVGVPRERDEGETDWRGGGVELLAILHQVNKTIAVHNPARGNIVGLAIRL